MMTHTRKHEHIAVRAGVEREAAGLCIAGLRMDLEHVPHHPEHLPDNDEVQGPFLYTLLREQADPDDPTQLTNAAASMV